MKDLKGVTSYPLWTALYGAPPYRCFNVQFGHSKGPNISRDTAWSLAKDYIKKHPDLSLVCVSAGGRKLNGY